MRVTVVWEDSRGVGVKNFGPHELLLRCILDQGHISEREVKSSINSVPKNGVGNVVRAIQKDGPKLVNRGALVAVIDLDRIHEQRQIPKGCKALLRADLLKDCQVEVEIVFLDRNIETLLQVACTHMGVENPRGKPTPTERDSILNRLAWHSQETRRLVSEDCPSFRRLVARVGELLT